MPGMTTRALHQQGLLVMGFFTGFAFTSLVIIIQSPSSFHYPVWVLSASEYFQVLVTLIAGIGAVCVIGVLSIMEVAGGIADVGSPLDYFGYACFVIVLFGFVVVLPLLLLPFTTIGSAVITMLEAVLLVFYFLSSGEKSVSK